MNMRKILWVTGLTLTILMSSCEKFLNVQPIDSMSGNNFWKTRDDVETYTLEMYRLLRQGFVVSKPLLMMIDVRSAPVRATAYPPRGDFNFLARNNILGLINTERRQGDINTWWQAYAEWDVFSDWSPLYRVIQSANILYEEVPNVANIDNSISPAMVSKYQAEAAFVRCLTYYYLLRVFGDVPYYTNAYNQEALPRTSHVEIAKKCLQELAQIKESLPWTYEDPANKAVRAMRGSVLALQMNLNMWLACFDEANKDAYYRAVDEAGTELLDQGETRERAYRLLSYDEMPSIFIGRSDEGLFEIPQNVNYGDVLGNRNKIIYTSVLHYPYFAHHQDANNSELTYEPAYLRLLYPEGEPDGRISLWFDDQMFSGGGKFSFFKYFNFAAETSNNSNTISNYFIIFRLADAILMQAEALAELGEDNRAIALLNRVRGRVSATPFPGGPGDRNLKDAIFYERSKELMLEGKHFFDLVRTRRIYNPDYSWYPMTYSQFMAGAWTWPINSKAFQNNPHMTLNNYWN